MNWCLACVLLLSSSVAFGQAIAKWVDEKGRVHYGDRPPATAKTLPISRGTMSGADSKDRALQGEQEAAFQRRHAERLARLDQEVRDRNNREAMRKQQEAQRLSEQAKQRYEGPRVIVRRYDLPPPPPPSPPRRPTVPSPTRPY